MTMEYSEIPLKSTLYKDDNDNESSKNNVAF